MINILANTKALLLFENPQDVLRAVEGGVAVKDSKCWVNGAFSW